MFFSYQQIDSLSHIFFLFVVLDVVLDRIWVVV